MSDNISRADAIEAVRKELVCDGRHEAHDKTCRFIADVLLPALPSAEGGDAKMLNEDFRPKYMQQCPTDGADLISREDAVKAIRKCKFESVMPSDWYIGMECAQDIVKDVPSAELTLQTPQTYGKSINPSNAEVVEDLISRSDAIEAVCEWGTAEERNGNLTMAMVSVKQGVADILSALPSADAVQGEWKPFDRTFGRSIWVCSACKSCTDVPCDAFTQKPIYEYCPNCGARMKGGAE